MAGKQLWEQRANHVGRGVFEQERLRIRMHFSNTELFFRSVSMSSEIELRTQIAYCLSINYSPEVLMNETNFIYKTNKQGQSIYSI